MFQLCFLMVFVIIGVVIAQIAFVEEADIDKKKMNLEVMYIITSSW